jgi:hypothetical protein
MTSEMSLEVILWTQWLLFSLTLAVSAFPAIFVQNVPVACSQEMNVLLLDACADFLNLNHRFRGLHHIQHKVSVFSVHELIRKTERQKVWLIFSHQSSFFNSRRTMALSELLVPMSMTRSSFFGRFIHYKPGIFIFTHSEFKLHTVLISAASGDSNRLRPQRIK